MSSHALGFVSIAAAVILAVSPSPAPQPVGSAAQDDEHAAPAKQHERLMKLAGRYSTVTKFTTPDGSAMPGSTGEATFTSTLGGRFLLQEEKGTMMGQSFEARKMYGYNTASKRYEALWVYTGATAMMSMTGASADDGKTITFAASYDGAGGAPSKLDIVITETGPDTLTIAMKSKAAPGEKSAVMETTYTRKK
jgi:hypothetical protein